LRIGALRLRREPEDCACESADEQTGTDAHYFLD
jgi:hypothetical protein